MRQIPRLFVEPQLETGLVVQLEDRHVHYLATVLRLQPGAELRLLDDRTGEWAAAVLEAGRKRVLVRIGG